MTPDPENLAITLPLDAVQTLHRLAAEYCNIHPAAPGSPAESALELVKAEIAQVMEAATSL